MNSNQPGMRPHSQAISNAPKAGYTSAAQEYTRTRVTHAVGIKAGMTKEEILKAFRNVPDHLKVESLAYLSGVLPMLADSTVVFVHFVEDIDTPTGAERVSPADSEQGTE